QMSAFDAVDGASSAASKWYRMIASKPERFKEVRPGNEMAFEVFKELARARRRNADTVDPGIGRTRLGQRTLKCVFLIGTRSAHSIRASGLTAAQTGRKHDRTRPVLQQRQKVLAKAPSTHDPKRTPANELSRLHVGERQLAIRIQYALNPLGGWEFIRKQRSCRHCHAVRISMK